MRSGEVIVDHCPEGLNPKRKPTNHNPTSHKSTNPKPNPTYPKP